MRRIRTLMMAAMLMCIAATCLASMIITENIAGITKRSDLVVRVTCLGAKAGFGGKLVPGAAKVAGMEPRTKGVTHYAFRIDEVVVDKTLRKWHEGDELSFSQFEGFTLSTGVVVSPSVRLPTFTEGSEYIVFFAVKGDRMYTIGINQGVFRVDDGVVSNPYMKTTMFKGVSTAAPGVAKAMQKAKIDVSSPPAKMGMTDFSTMVRAIAAAEGVIP